jgi:2-polyprenyl-3-methyl-5-hydroxy-6-metoxy-1,4-benzoquinol methylase
MPTTRNVTEFTFGVSDYDKYWQARKAGGDVAATGIHRFILELVRRYVPAGAKVLDCGVGPAIYYQELLGEYEMYGIEFSEEAIELYPFDTSRITAFDLNDGLPEFDTLFGGMVASMIIHHLDDPRIFLRAARERMEPGGIFIIVHPNLVYFKHRLRLLSGKFPKYSTSHRNFIAPKLLTEMIEEAGFSVKKIASRKNKRFPILFAHELFYICEA